MLSCLAADDCTSVSPPLARAEQYGSDFPAASGHPYALADGRWIGWRQVPTAAAPTPPVQPITWEIKGAATTTTDPPSPPANFPIAPMYLGADGSPLMTF